MRAWRVGVFFALIVSLGLLTLWKVIYDRAPDDEPPAAVASPAYTPPEQSLETSAAVERASPDTPSQGFGTLRGRVVDAVTGDPVREFGVVFHIDRSAQYGSEPQDERRFRSEDGKFEWPYLVPGIWTVTASASGYQRFMLPRVLVPEGEATSEIVFPLRRGLTLRGRVYDEATGVGIAAASLSFRESHVGRHEGEWQLQEQTLTREDGSFVLDGLPPGRVILTISAHDYGRQERDVLVEGAGVLDIALSAGGTIAGRLTGPDGATPVAGVIVIAGPDPSSMALSPTATGEFSFEHLAPGRYRVSGSAQESVTAPIEIVLARNQRVRGLVLSLARGRTIRGVVTGLPEEQRKAVAIGLRREGTYMAAVSVDAQGSYALHGLQPGRVELVASHPTLPQISKSVTVPADADLKVDFQFTAGVKLSGRVIRGGRPVPEMWMRAQPTAGTQTSASAQTSASGEYAIEGLSPGEYRVDAGTLATQRVRISGDTMLDFDLPDAHVSGQVLKEDGRAPVVGVDVEIWSADSYVPREGLKRAAADERSSSPMRDAWRVRLHDQTDHYGAFSLVGLEPGDFVLTAYKPGYEMLRQTLSFSTSVSDMTLKLRADEGVEIRARDASTGKALRSIFVVQRIGAGHGSRLGVHLDVDGTGYLPAALAGSPLMISAEGYVAANLAAWDGLPLDLRLSRSTE